MSDEFWQSPTDLQRDFRLWRVLVSRGWGHCELLFLAGSTMRAKAIMQYQRGPDRDPLPITITFTPRVENEVIAGFKLVRVDLPDGTGYFGDNLTRWWTVRDITATAFCAGVADLLGP